MDIFYLLLILLLVTRAFGEIAHRVGQPPLVGELIAGISMGMMANLFPDFMPEILHTRDNPVFIALGELGMFFLMLYGGVELRASELAEASHKSLIIAASGLILPLAVGFGLSWMLFPESELKLAQCLLVGAALAVTAVPVSIRILMDLGQLETRVGRTIVAAAVIDDLFSLVLLAVLTGFITTGASLDMSSLLTLFISIFIFFAAAFGVGRVLVPHVGKFVKSLKTIEFEFSSLMLAALAFSVIADYLGLHFIIGAFTAGLLFERRIAGSKIYDEVRKRLRAITLGFLAPIFFASIGMHLDIKALGSIPVFIAILITVAFLTKLIGAGVPAYLLGYSKREASAIGIGMSARGAVELIIADIALRAGLFSQPEPPPPIIANLFSAIVFVAIVTTILTPIILRRVYR